MHCYAGHRFLDLHRNNQLFTWSAVSDITLYDPHIQYQFTNTLNDSSTLSQSTINSENSTP